MNLLPNLNQAVENASLTTTVPFIVFTIPLLDHYRSSPNVLSITALTHQGSKYVYIMHGSPMCTHCHQHTDSSLFFHKILIEAYFVGMA